MFLPPLFTQHGLTKVSQYDHLDRLSAHRARFVPLLQLPCAREARHEVSRFAMYYAPIFRSTLAYDAGLYAANRQTGLHAFLFAWHFSLLGLLVVLLTAAKHAARRRRLRIIFTFLGLGYLYCFLFILLHGWFFVFSHFHFLTVRYIKTFFRF